jgi:SPP1 gp7 family putative phage head morphogenesis protein
MRLTRSVHANRGQATRYRRQILALIDAMVAEVEHHVIVTYRTDTPVVAMDASPVKAMREQLRKLAARWIKRFDDYAPKIAEAYLKGSFKATDSAMRQALKDAGWTVKFEMTPAVREAFEASLAENVGLIRSIPQEYLQQVEGAVMRSYSIGRDLQTMVRDIKRIYPKAANRATLIARDQSNKANAVVTRARQTELGIIEAIWMHSHAGKTPRPDHVAANGKRYKVSEGCLISGEYLLPGELINCRCTSRSVLPGF